MGDGVEVTDDRKVVVVVMSEERDDRKLLMVVMCEAMKEREDLTWATDEMMDDGTEVSDEQRERKMMQMEWWEMELK